MSAITTPHLTDDTDLSSVEARRITDQIRIGLEGSWQLIVKAFNGRVWIALGYNTWDEYVRREFGNLVLAVPREGRDEIIVSMREAGMSLRAIAPAVGVSKDTAQRVIARALPVGEPNVSDETVGGGVVIDHPSTITSVNGRPYKNNPPTRIIPPSPRDAALANARESFKRTSMIAEQLELVDASGREEIAPVVSAQLVDVATTSLHWLAELVPLLTATHPERLDAWVAQVSGLQQLLDSLDSAITASALERSS